LESADLAEYYRRRAAEYEAVYAKPERQADLASLREEIPARLRGARVLEIACGTGYWTELISRAASSLAATDVAEEPMRIAQAKSYSGSVTFLAADAYALPEALGKFDAAFAGFWWSHVPRERIGEFLGSLHARLEPGARVLFLDNRYVEGSSTPIVGLDAAGNSYQLRRLADGAEFRVLKNFPSEEELRACLGRSLMLKNFQHYWLAEYRWG
jgi:demethylmenaquinone methyltransferase/2-methoxy-6-polyprenyl-1,4-benzoquinol methylase